MTQIDYYVRAKEENNGKRQGKQIRTIRNKNKLTLFFNNKALVGRENAEEKLMLIKNICMEKQFKPDRGRKKILFCGKRKTVHEITGKRKNTTA